jgi:hypothetical protein
LPFPSPDHLWRSRHLAPIPEWPRGGGRGRSEP